MKDKWATRMVGLLSILLASLLLGLYLTLSSAGSLAQEPVGAMPGNVLALLETLASLPVQEYNLKSQDPAIRHVGLVAQDFAALGYGESDLAINMQDADGVALAAIQGLYERVQALEAENADLRDQLGELEPRLAALEAGLGAGRSSVRMPSGWLLLGGGVLAFGAVVGRRIRGGGR